VSTRLVVHCADEIVPVYEISTICLQYSVYLFILVGFICAPLYYNYARNQINRVTQNKRLGIIVIQL
jgi:hypothetical protein